MAVTTVRKDLAGLTMTVAAEFDASPQRGPEGEHPLSYWESVQVDGPPNSLVFRDGYANEDETPDPESQS